MRGKTPDLPRISGPLLALMVIAVVLWPSPTTSEAVSLGEIYGRSLAAASPTAPNGSMVPQAATVTVTFTPTATPAWAATSAAATSVQSIIETFVAQTATAAAETATAAPIVTATYAAGQTATVVAAPTTTALAAAASTAVAQTQTAAPSATMGFALTQTAVAMAGTAAALASQTAAAQTVTAAVIPTATYQALLTQTAGPWATYDAQATQTAVAWNSWTPLPTYTPTATVAAPSNDDFGSAIQIDSLPYTTTQDTRGATLASDDPNMGNDAGKNSATVWFKFTAQATGNVQANTRDSDYDTVLAAFTGSRGSLSLVTSNDDINSSTRQSEISFNVQSGTVYYLEIANYGSGGFGGRLHLSVQLGSGSITSTPTPGTPTPGTPTPESTPRAAGATPATRNGVEPAATPVPSTGDPRYFQATGFRITRDSFWDYFTKRGGIRTFGYPISREFTFSGFQVQLFQRGMLQQKPDGGVTTVNLLDEGIMPYTRINGSTFPAVDAALKKRSPSPSDPSYAEKALAFLDGEVPDQWNDMQVDFHRTFTATVGMQDAFPLGDGEPALLPLMDLEMWGLPTSPPAEDPSNHNFVYQRFQRGIMHYDRTRGTTEGLLLGDYLKSIMTGDGLPSDLESQARNSPFYRQYDRSRPGFLARPSGLRGTNLVGAFEMDLPQ